MKASGRFLILEAGLLASVVLAPLFFGAVYPWGSLTLAAIVFFLAFLYPEFLAQIPSLPRPSTVGMCSVFVFVALQFLFLSVNRYETGLEFLKWSAWACAFLLVQLLPQDSLARLLGFACAVGVFESVYGLFQVMTHGEKVLWQMKEAHHGFVTGTYLNRNHAAGLLELCLGVQIGFLLRYQDARNKAALWISVSAFLVTFAGFVRTGSRMGLTSFLISFFAMSFLFLKKTRAPLVPFLILTLFMVTIPLGWGREALLARFEEIARGNLYNWEGGRFQVWWDAMKILKDYPWFGIGLGSFEWVFPAYQSEKLLMGWSHAHNGFLELAIELGWPAFGVWLGSWVFMMSPLLARSFQSAPSVSSFSWGLWVSILSFTVHGLTDFNFSIPANVFVFILLCAALVRFLRLQEEAARRG